MKIIKQIPKLGNISKFCWKEMLSDNTGKTSASSFTGVLCILTGLITFAFSIFFSKENFITHAITVIETGALLLGVNKIVNGKPVTETQELEKSNNNSE